MAWLHVIVIAQWVGLNWPGVPWPRFDPGYTVLGTVLAVEFAVVWLALSFRWGRRDEEDQWRRELERRRRLLNERRLARLLQLAAEALPKRAADGEPPEEASIPFQGMPLRRSHFGRPPPKRRGRS